MNTVVSVASLVSAAVIPSPSIAENLPKSDPIFPVIERHRAAVVEWLRQVALESELHEILPIERRRTFHREDLKVRALREGDDPRWIDSRKCYWRASDAMQRASDDLTTVRPSTLAGAIAVLRHVDEVLRGEIRIGAEHFSEECVFPEHAVDSEDLPYSYGLLNNLRRALEAIALCGAEVFNPAPSRNDPVYAAIEQHRAMVDAAEASCSRYSKVEEQYFKLRKQTSVDPAVLLAAKVAANRESKRHERVTDRECRAFDAVWEVKPTTSAGYDAWLDYIQSMGNDQRLGLLLNDGAIADFIQKIRHGGSL